MGISADTMSSHEKYAAKLELPFPLLSDREKVVCRQFDVLKPIVNMITRTVIVLDQSGETVYRQAGAPAMQEVVDSLREKGVVPGV